MLPRTTRSQLAKHSPRSLALTANAALALAGLAGCGSTADGNAPAPTARPSTAGIVLDVSESVRASVMTGVYAPAATAFAQRAIADGTKRLCVAYGGAEIIASPKNCLPIQPTKSGPEGKQQTATILRALNGAIASIGARRSQLAGGSSVFELITAMAPLVTPGQRILVASDMVQNSRQVGDFAAGRLRFDEPGRAALLDELDRLHLIPNLHGVTLVIPYPIDHGDTPTHLDERRKSEIHEVWDAWTAKTGATLAWGAAPDA